MKEGPLMDIRHENDHWTLYIDGRFIGNYDTATEAAIEYERILFGKEN